MERYKQQFDSDSARVLIDRAVRAAGCESRYQLAGVLGIPYRTLRRYYASDRLPETSRSFLQFVVSVVELFDDPSQPPVPARIAKRLRPWTAPPATCRQSA